MVSVIVEQWKPLRGRESECCVIAVEPTDSIDGYPCEYIKKAAWLFDGKLRFGGAFYYTSAFEDATHEYECFDVNSLLSRFDQIALLKINVEGAEYDLLDHIISEGLHEQVRHFQIQFHLVEGDDSLSRCGIIHEHLSCAHKVEWIYPFCWESWRRRA